jgi:hypothetical protein
MPGNRLNVMRYAILPLTTAGAPRHLLQGVGSSAASCDPPLT